MDIVTYALAKNGAKAYTDEAIAGLGAGFEYKGTVASIEDLPSDASKGDEYTVSGKGPHVYDGSNWQPVGIKGEKGEKGDIGPQGEPGRNGGETNAYNEIHKVKDYLYEVYYDTCDYAYAKEYFEKRKVNLSGACSAVRKGNFYGRNFDWVYDEGAEFIVRTPRIGNRFASMGVVGHVDELTNEFVESGEFSRDYKILPFKIVDGINEYGLVANSNVVPNDKGINPEAFPAIEERDRICNLALVRYILDNFKTAQEAVEYIRDYVTIYPVKTLEDMNYELHFMIADENKTYVLEIVDNVVRIIDVTNKPMMTNFYLYGVTFNADGKTYYPAINDATHNAKITNGVTDHGCGLERYAKIVDAYNELDDLDSMANFMAHGLRYTNAYTGGDTEIGEWCTEFVDGNLTVESGSEDFETAIAAAQYAYQHRTRNPKEEYFGTWQSTHSVVYDIENREMNIIVQEDDEELKYSFNELVSNDNSSKQDKIDNNLKTEDKTIVGGINEVNSLAKMSNKAKAYVNYQELITELNAGTKSKNLFNIKNYYIEGSVLYLENPIGASGNYTISAQNECTYPDGGLSIEFRNGSGNLIGNRINNDNSFGTTNMYFTFDVTAEQAAAPYLVFKFPASGSQTININYLINMLIQIETGTTATAYEEYYLNPMYQLGQTMYIQTLNVPDLWICGIEKNKVTYTYTTDAQFITDSGAAGGIQVGYYKLGQLETLKQDLTNYVQNTDYATTSKAGLIRANDNYALSVGNTNGIAYAQVKTYSQYENGDSYMFIGKGTLENIFANKYKSFAGYDASKTQILKHVSGVLTWVDE